jgi:hypothetical protein
MVGVPDAVQRFFSGAPQSRDPFPLVVENMLAAGVAHAGRALGFPRSHWECSGKTHPPIPIDSPKHVSFILEHIMNK